MGIQFGRVPIITEQVPDMMALVQAVNWRIDEFNRALHEVELEVSKIEGYDSNTPQFFNDVSLQGLYRIKNVMRSKDPQDVVTRRELQELGLFDLPDVSSFATISDVENAISGAIDSNVATSSSGDIVDVEDAAGVNGSTDGTLSMAVDEGKAQFLRMVQGELVVRDTEIRTLLELILEELRSLNK